MKFKFSFLILVTLFHLFANGEQIINVPLVTLLRGMRVFEQPFSSFDSDIKSTLSSSVDVQIQNAENKIYKYERKPKRLSHISYIFPKSIGNKLIWETPSSLKGFSFNSLSSSSNPITGELSVSSTFSNFSRKLTASIVCNRNESVAISPLFVQSALTLLFLGSNGQTATLLRQNLNLGNLNRNDIANEFQNVLKPYQHNSAFKLANGIFVNDNSQINSKFQTIASDSFFTFVEPMKFQNNDVKRKINEWVNNCTDSRITKIIQSPTTINSATSLLLANAVYFHGLWKFQFSTESMNPMTFYTNNQCSQKYSKSLDGYFNIGYWRYGNIKSLDASVIEFPYRESDLTMFIVLPNQCGGIKNLLENLKSFDINEFRGQNNTWLGVTLPLFNLEYSINLNEILKDLGLGEILTKNANFDGMKMVQSESSSARNHPLYVSEFVHKVSINMTESQELANYINVKKALRFRGFGPHVPNGPRWIGFTLNHPFAFFITSPNDVIVAGKFMG